MKELFEKVYIESDADLPKEGIYIVKAADNDTPEFMRMSKTIGVFWNKVAWYLRPIAEAMPTEEEIRYQADLKFTEFAHKAFWTGGALWFRNRMGGKEK